MDRPFGAAVCWVASCVDFYYPPTTFLSSVLDISPWLIISNVHEARDTIIEGGAEVALVFLFQPLLPSVLYSELRYYFFIVAFNSERSLGQTTISVRVNIRGLRDSSALRLAQQVLVLAGLCHNKLQ